VISILLTLPLLLSPAEGDSAQQGVALPEGPVARAWAGVGEGTRAIDLGTALLGEAAWLADPAAATPERRWSAWARWLGEGARAPRPDPKRRAGLLLLARDQGRWRDAWIHLERLGGTPEWAAAAMPHLVPGVPLGTPAGRGGLPGPLPDGALLRPVPPPALEYPEGGRPVARSVTVEGLRIGEAIVTFVVTVEASGIEVDVTHTGGGPARLRVLLPTPPGQEIRVEYVDWMRQDEVGSPLLLELSPGDEEHSLYGRFVPRREALPATPAGELPQQLLRGGLWIECAEGSAAEPESRAAARAFGELLGLRTGISRPGGPSPTPPWSATILRLPSEEAEATRFLGRIASAVEERVAGGR